MKQWEQLFETVTKENKSFQKLFTIVGLEKIQSQSLVKNVLRAGKNTFPITSLWSGMRIHSILI